MPESIIESELFGHERGAFTGALGAPGLFRMANQGTLFLDEVGEIPPPVQAKLLRALQHKEVRPVGSPSTVPVDIRVISATHRDLAAMVADGRFRTDLFYRLNVVRIEIPPLRERREDIPLLVQHFLRKHADRACRIEGIEDDALEQLVRADWPGNVRELENVIESAIALAPGPRLRAADLPRARRGGAAAPLAADVPLSLEAYERCALERALREAGGDAHRAAQLLGVGRSTLYRKLSKHGLAPRRGAARRPRWGRVSHPPSDAKFESAGEPGAPAGRVRRVPTTTPAPRWLLLARAGAPRVCARAHAGARRGHAARRERGRSGARAGALPRGGRRARDRRSRARCGARALARGAAPRGPTRAGGGRAGRGRRAAAPARARVPTTTRSSRT